MNELIKKYQKEKRWVNYRKLTRKGKTTKVPYSPVTKKMASSTNPEDWTDYKTAKAVSNDVGIVFTPEQNLLGIDIDHCLKDKKITHEQKETIAELILEADTYTEISPSGEGLHLFLEITGKLSLEGNKKSPFEIYTSGRYFTFTANIYGESRPVRKVTPEEALKILKIIGYPFKTDASLDNDAHVEPVKKASAQKTSKVSGSLSDDQVLKKLFDSKNGEKAKRLYEGDLSDHKDDASSADMALLSHFAFWTGRNADQMERLWLASPLGSRKKTQERLDYRKRSIENAIKSCKTIYETPQQKMESIAPDMDLLYTMGSKGNIIYLQNLENMCRVLRKHEAFAGKFRYDVFKNVFEIKENDKWRILESNDAVNIQSLISIYFTDWFGKVGKDLIYDAILKVSKENAIDSAKDWITSLKWDGKNRLDSWLSSVYGVEDNKYHKAVAANWMKGLVNRIVNPGCKFDYVLVLEGEQGSKKSTSLGVLGGDWHVETTMSTESKDFFMQFQGKAIVEFSEGETLNRTEVKRMKAIITTQFDKYRPPYERVSQDFPRRCVFAMTTNQDEYLKDETGNRRWLPVKVMLPQADVEWLKENRDQLFAEAYTRLMKGETTYEFPIEETLLEQQKRRVSDPNQDRIMQWYVSDVNESDKAEGITIDRVWKEALHGNMPSRTMNKYEQMAIATILKDHLRLTKKQTMKSGVRASRWFNETGERMHASEEEQEEIFNSSNF